MLRDMSASDNNPGGPTAASQQHPPSGTKSVFVAAGEIETILDGREKAEQERIIRWVSENLGLGTGPGGVAIHPTSTPHTTPPILASSERHTQAAQATGHPKDIKVFVEEKKPKNDMQFAAVVAYYYHFEATAPNRLETITPGHVQEAARLAGRPRFKNPGVPLNNAVNAGYFDRRGRGEFRLNAVGENLVAMTLPGTADDTDEDDGPRRPRKKRASKPADKRSTKPRAS
jgi:hypothetical protein